MFEGTNKFITHKCDDQLIILYQVLNHYSTEASS